MRRIASLLLFIILAGLAVRAVGVDFGLPFLYHNDEPLIVHYALAYGRGDLNPHFFKIPPLLSYCLFFLYGIFYLLGRLFGIFSGMDSFGRLFLNNPTAFYLIGRLFTGTLWGTLSIPFVYILGKKAFNQNTGLLSALFLALNFLHVRDSHYIYTDIPLVFSVIVTFILLYRLFERDRLRDYLYLGFMLGVSASVKYNALLLGLPVLIVLIRNLLFFKKGLKDRIRSLGIMALFFVAALFLTNPFMFIDYRFFIRYARGPFFNPGFWFHLKVSILGGCGLFMSIAAVLGMGYAILKRKAFGIIILIFTVFYYITISRISQTGERYIFPILPLLLIFSAYFITSVLSYIRIANLWYGISKSATTENCTPKLLPKAIFLRRGLGFLICAAVMLPSLVKIYYCDILFIREDTRTQAYRWVKENIPAGTKIAIDATGPIYPAIEKTKEQIAESYERLTNQKFKKPKGAVAYKVKLQLENPDYPKITYRLYYLKPELGYMRFLVSYPELGLDLNQIRKEGIEFIILNGILREDRYAPFFQEVEAGSYLLKEFSPYKYGYSRLKPIEYTNVPAAAFTLKELSERESFGPVIRIYKLKIE